MTVSSHEYLETKGSSPVVLVVGATGFMGRMIAEASLDSGRKTFIVVRPSVNVSPTKEKYVKSLVDKGAIVMQGMANNKDWMEKVLKENEIEVVISVVGGANVLDQIPLVEAIKAVGTVKRFLPSEFGHDVDRANPVEPGLTMYKEKRQVRRAVEESGVPYTYICCNSIASWPYHDNTHPAEVSPPLDQFQIYGDATVKAYFVAGSDIGKFTMKAVDDPRTSNKILHFRPPCNYLNMNELASIWEKKIGKTLPRVTIAEEDLLKAAAENRIPESIVAAFTHDIFIEGCQVNFSIYPNETFRTIEHCFEEYIVGGVKDDNAAKEASGREEAPTATRASDVRHISVLSC